MYISDDYYMNNLLMNYYMHAYVAIILMII